MFLTTVNPFGVMYNPASVLHTLERMYADEASAFAVPDVAVLSLGTNHVYILNETGEIVDNCEKRPQRLFTEKILSMEECTDYLTRCVNLLQQVNPDVRIIFTVSPIRYAKYGFHESQLSKATLLMAIHALLSSFNCQLSTVNCCTSPPTRSCWMSCATTVSTHLTCFIPLSRQWIISMSGSLKPSSQRKRFDSWRSIVPSNKR